MRQCPTEGAAVTNLRVGDLEVAFGSPDGDALFLANLQRGIDAVHDALAATDIPLDARGNPVTGERTGVAESGGKRSPCSLGNAPL